MGPPEEKVRIYSLGETENPLLGCRRKGGGWGGVKETFVSLNPEDCCSQHAPHLRMNDTLVCRRGQNLTPPPSPGTLPRPLIRAAHTCRGRDGGADGAR